MYPISQKILDNCPDKSQGVVFCVAYATSFSRAICQEHLMLAIREQGQEVIGKTQTYAGREAEYMLDSNGVLYGRHFVSEYYTEDDLWAVSCSFNYVTWSIQDFSVKTHEATAVTRPPIPTSIPTVSPEPTATVRLTSTPKPIPTHTPTATATQTPVNFTTSGWWQREFDAAHPTVSILGVGDSDLDDFDFALSCFQHRVPVAVIRAYQDYTFSGHIDEIVFYALQGSAEPERILTFYPESLEGDAGILSPFVVDNASAIVWDAESQVSQIVTQIQELAQTDKRFAIAVDSSSGLAPVALFDPYGFDEVLGYLTCLTV